MWALSLLLILAAVGVLLGVYRLSQEELTLEGNRLYSTQSIIVSAKLPELENIWNGKDQTFVAYRDLDEEGQVRAVFGSNIESVKYPIYDGRAFRRGEFGTALVGGNVKLEERDEDRFVNHDGQKYRVVGYLGRNSGSLLQDMVLIHDRSLFTEINEVRMALDGANVRKNYEKAFPNKSIEFVNKSTNRRTTVDYVSPIILALGYGIQLLGSAYLGILVAAQVRQGNRIAFLLGKGRGRLLLKSIALLVAFFLASVAIFGAISAFAPFVGSARDVYVDLLAVMTVTLVVFISSVVVDLRESQ